MLSVLLGGSFQARYELRGKIHGLDRTLIRHEQPYVTILAAAVPFEKQSLIGHGGDFKFKKLDPGGYRLRIVVPGWGEMERSVEVGPTFADEKGRVHIEFEFKPDYSTGTVATVSPEVLTVSEKSRKEFRKAQKELGKKNVEKAIQHLEKAIEDSPGYTSALNRLGTIYFLEKEYVKAEKYFIRALKTDPTAYSPLVNLCAAQFALQKVQEALECNLKAVERDPNDALAYSQLGRSYFALKQFESAKESLRKAKQLDPGHFSYPQLILAEIYRIRADWAGMAREIEEFLRYHPDAGFAPKLKEILESLKKEQRR